MAAPAKKKEHGNKGVRPPGLGKFKTSPQERGRKGGKMNGIYSPEVYDERAYRLSLLTGGKEESLALAFGVTTYCIQDWRRKHHSFDSAVRRGTLDADAGVVDGLYRRAMGMIVKEVKNIHTPDQAQKGSPLKVARKEVTERELPPNVGAAFIWLRNRHREQWGNNGPAEQQQDRLQEIADLIRMGPASSDAKTVTLSAPSNSNDNDKE